jgi:hypothetical protein
VFAPKFGTRPIRLTPPVRPVSLNGLIGGTSCSRSGNGHTGRTGGLDQFDRCTPSPSRIEESLRISSCKRIPCGARPLHPINIKGHGCLRWLHPIDHYFSQLLSLKPKLFQPHAFLVCLDDNQGRSEWPCQPHSNPRRATSDGVPPEAAILGFHCASAYTGQTGAPDQSNRSGQELGEFSDVLRDLVLVCVDQKSINILLATPLGKKDLVAKTVQAWCEHDMNNIGIASLEDLPLKEH